MTTMAALAALLPEPPLVLLPATATPIEPVLALFALLLGLAVARTLPALVSFYSWFAHCGFEMAEHRGYGQSACKAFGIIPAPKLSVPAMALSGTAFLALVTLPATPLVAASLRAPLLALAIVFYHLYFSQLYCEAHVGAHVTVLIPPALLLLSLCPALDADAAADPTASAQAAAFTAWCMKVILTSAYCGAGVCKISHSVASMRKGGSSWCTGSTLQAFIYEAMFLSNPSTHSSFGLPTPGSYYGQRLHVLFPRALLMPASFGAVAFETLAPLLLVAPAHVASVPFGLFGLVFHYGIALLQNIDFISWWSPAYAFLLLDPAAWHAGLFGAPDPHAQAALAPLAAAKAVLAAHPLRASLSLAYVAVHLGALVVLRFYPSVEILPLSSFPMFGSPHNLFDRRLRKNVWLTGKAHATGTLKNYAFPFCRKQTVLPHEIDRLPFKYLLLSHGGDQPTKVLGNVEVTARLQAALDAMVRLGAQEPDTFATDGGVAAAALDALDEAKAAFDVAPRRRAAGGDASLDVGATLSTTEAIIGKGMADPASAQECMVNSDGAAASSFAAGPSGGGGGLRQRKAAAAKDEAAAAAAAAAASLSTATAPRAPPSGALIVYDALRVRLIRAAVGAAVVLLSAIDVIMRAALAAVHAAQRVRAALVGGPTAPRPKVVIVGGSFSGLRVQRAVSAACDVTLVDPKEYFEYTPGVLRLFTQPDHLGGLTTPLPRARNRVVTGTATSVSDGAVFVEPTIATTTSAADAATRPTAVPYDYLVLGCGVGYPCAPIKPTAAEPTIDDRRGTWRRAADTLRAAPSALVVGGGLVGVELAAEIVAAYPSKPLTLVTHGDALCGGLPRAVGAYCEAWLRRRGVAIVYGADVAAVDAARGVVRLAGGETLQCGAGAAYDCRGNGAPNAAPLLSGGGGGAGKGDGPAAWAARALDGKGRVRVDETLRVDGARGSNVFAMGDAMALPGCRDLKLGHTAELNADVVAENILHLTRAAAPSNGTTAASGGEAAAGLEAYPQGAVGAAVAPRVFCVSLGESDGVLSFNGVVVPGLAAALAKPLLEWTKVAACAERPVGVAFWIFGDAVANWISRVLMPPKA